jgi:putative oxidoreductase
MQPPVTPTGTALTGCRARLVAVTAWLGRLPLPLVQLCFRLAIASVFLKAGLTKMASWEGTVRLFADKYQVPVLSPEVAALMATTVEVSCSPLLALGLATRVATLPLLGMIAVMQLFVYPHAWSEHLTWGSILLFLLTRGGGPLALDRLVGLEPAQTDNAEGEHHAQSRA